MARKKQHPDIGKYVARYEHGEGEMLIDDSDKFVETFDTPEEALALTAGQLDDGDVIYVYAVVGVKVVRHPTITEDFP